MRTAGTIAIIALRDPQLLFGLKKSTAPLVISVDRANNGNLKFLLMNAQVGGHHRSKAYQSDPFCKPSA